MKYEKIEAGMLLYDVHSVGMGNTKMKTLGVWPARVIEMFPERRVAMVSWNTNPPRLYFERELAKLKAKPPILIRNSMGMARRATREEIKAMKETQ